MGEVRVPVDRSVQNMLEDQNIARFKVRRQAARVRGVGKSSVAEGRAKPNTPNSAARRGSRVTPPPPFSSAHVVRAAIPSGPAPSYAGFALSLLILLAGAGLIGVVVVVWVIQSAIERIGGRV